METIDEAFERGKLALRKSPHKFEELVALGKERELLYLVLVTTGLRKGELQSITVGNTDLDPSQAWITLNSQDEKAGRGATLPLHPDVADRLREFLKERLERLRNPPQAETLSIKGIPKQLPLDSPLFNVPTDLVRILGRDLAAAGIPKVDERGRTVDVHAMRHTFGTMLQRAGVAPALHKLPCVIATSINNENLQSSFKTRCRWRRKKPPFDR